MGCGVAEVEEKRYRTAQRLVSVRRASAGDPRSAEVNLLQKFIRRLSSINEEQESVNFKMVKEMLNGGIEDFRSLPELKLRCFITFLAIVFLVFEDFKYLFKVNRKILGIKIS